MKRKQTNTIKLLLLVIISFIINLPIKAQSFRKYSNEFLNIGADARAFGMGNNVVANVSDVNSVYWNPAGLTQVTDSWQAALMHAEYFQSIAKYEYAAVAIPLNGGTEGTVGISLYRFAVDDIMNTTQLIDNQGNIDYNKISRFSTADYALMGSYAGNLFNDPNLSVGANAKIVYRHVGKFANAFGFGLDAGLQYRTEDKFYFGVMVRDITTTFNVWSVNEKELNKMELDGETLNEAPEDKIELTIPKLKLGVAKKLDISEKIGFLAEANLNFEFSKTNDLVSSDVVSMSPSLGVEFDYDNTVFLRAGFTNMQHEMQYDGTKKITMQPNAGIGFKYRGVTVDYALTNIGNASVALYSNIFSVKIDIAEFHR
ncbi:PorV/PorQ family protein [Apibacter raozihei]|uniref:putative type IX sorting system protein PorV2 n=1 Tax=Apibacter raozihei TaxID=2500547 RepID=UPI001E404E21|nr:PorV/PorQ family protein [Apibacter raozihei]